MVGSFDPARSLKAGSVLDVGQDKTLGNSEVQEDAVDLFPLATLMISHFILCKNWDLVSSLATGFKTKICTTGFPECGGFIN